jgi:cytochrome P450
VSDIPLTTLDPHDPAHLADPYPAWQRAQDGGRPVYLRALRAWAVTSHDQVLAVVRDPATYSSAPSESSERDLASLRSTVPHACPEDFHALANSDPPTHTRIRRAAQKMLTPRSVSVYEPYVRSVCAGLIEGFAADGRADIVQRLAVPLPLTVICHVLGIDPGSQQSLKQWSDDTVRLHMPGLSADERIGLARSSAELHDFLARLIAARRLDPRPGDLVSTLVQPADGSGPALTGDEAIGVLTQLLIGGHETLTALISSMALLLARDRGLADRLRREPALGPAMVEETLRYRSPVKGMTRTTTRDVELGGQPIPAGARLLVLFGAANRDPIRFSCPGSFDLDRTSTGEHVAFGRGIHACIGAPLARLEARVALEQIASRLPGLRLPSGGRLSYLPSFMVYSIGALELEWDKGLRATPTQPVVTICSGVPPGPGRQACSGVRPGSTRSKPSKRRRIWSLPRSHRPLALLYACIALARTSSGTSSPESWPSTRKLPEQKASLKAATIPAGSSSSDTKCRTWRRITATG